MVNSRPGQILLHQHRLPESPQKAVADPPELRQAVQPGGGVHALACAFGNGLGEEREGQVHGLEVCRCGDNGESGRTKSRRLYDPLGHGLVQCQGTDQGI